MRSPRALRDLSTSRVKRRLVDVMCHVTTAKASETRASAICTSLKDPAKLPTIMLRMRTAHTQKVQMTDALSSNDARRLIASW